MHSQPSHHFTTSESSAVGTGSGPFGSPNHSGLREPSRLIQNHAPGHTVRPHLFEIQKADRGRKYATVDRRPLDPPPVAALQIIDTYDTGTFTERQELRIPEADSVLGLICCVDLFSVPAPDSQRLPDGDGLSPSASTSRAGFVVFPSANATTPRQLQGPISASSLVGEMIVQPTVVDWQGKDQIMFVFGDLSVRLEGWFLLHYRVFDITGVSNRRHGTILTECFGQPFQVFSTKEFPGLGPSTDLTKQLSLYGCRVNTRSSDRRKKHYRDNESRAGANRK